MTLTLDRKRHHNRNPVRTGTTEARYGGQLCALARQIGKMVGHFPLDDPRHYGSIEHLLMRYAEMLTPWAESTAAQMLADISRNDVSGWMRLTQDMGRSLRDEIRNAPTGATMRQLLVEQVALIKSIPEDAARRVHELSVAALSDGRRASEISLAIQQSGDVAKSRAILIARTEVSRAASTLTEARARHIGSEGYFWRTAGDGDVRPSHAAMEGKYVRWDEPPMLDRMRGHAGCVPNCRCYPEPDIPKD